jgi:ABC transporter substrate binding protein (PQQ-dependent alcohol dehydrogenase system)
MRDGDWAAWLAVKAVATAVQRTRSEDFATLRDHLLSPDLVLDGFKGNRLGFRPWDNQLRQPILLATHNHVVARAPVEGFLHRTNNLDTLGVDEPETTCRMTPG